MMKKYIFAIALFSLISISVISGVANAYWIWTPETKKFTNPKYAVKDSPKEQFDWAMSFYNAKDFQRAATEFEKLAKQYEFSEYASKAQYYVGLCYENMNKYYLAYQNYQKAIDNFPHIANTEEILAREFAIANLYLSKPGPKILGTDIMAPLDRAVEIFKKVVENAPYGKFAEESQFKLGEALKKSERYEEAVQAFHKIVEDYPKSKLATQAMYEESNCAYKASLKPAYDAAATDNAIKTFEKFVYKNKDADLARNADTTMKRLKDNVAEKSFKAAEFYESQGKTQAAIIYYQDVIDTYPDSTFVNKAKAKIEALKAKGTKKTVVPIDMNKKKPKRVVREKKPWNPLSFKSGKSEKKAEAVTPEASKKKNWNPLNLFNLGTKKEPVVKEASKRKAWKPLSFDAIRKAKPEKVPEAPAVVEASIVQTIGQEVVAPVAEASLALPSAPQTIEAPQIEPSTQPAETTIVENPIVSPQTVEPQAVEVSHTPDVKPEEVPQSETQKVEIPVPEVPAVEVTKKEEAIAQVQEEPKNKTWKPFNFDFRKEPVVKKASEKKGWKPLYFGTNDEPMAATNRRW